MAALSKPIEKQRKEFFSSKRVCPGNRNEARGRKAIWQKKPRSKSGGASRSDKDGVRKRPIAGKGEYIHRIAMAIDLGQFPSSQAKKNLLNISQHALPALEAATRRAEA
jgi:hypothetical protein